MKQGKGHPFMNMHQVLIARAIICENLRGIAQVVLKILHDKRKALETLHYTW
jgi:hypothetical protein